MWISASTGQGNSRVFVGHQESKFESRAIGPDQRRSQVNGTIREAMTQGERVQTRTGPSRLLGYARISTNSF